MDMPADLWSKEGARGFGKMERVRRSEGQKSKRAEKQKARRENNEYKCVTRDLIFLFLFFCSFVLLLFYLSA
jgi:hypothetical protein